MGFMAGSGLECASGSRVRVLNPNGPSTKYLIISNSAQSLTGT